MPVGRLTPTVAKARGEVASLSRSRAKDDPEYIAARQRLKEANFQEYISRTVNTFPQLRQDQIDRLAGLVRPYGAEASPARAKAIKQTTRPTKGDVNAQS